MDLAHLGTPIGPMRRVDGGFANRLYRLDTDEGSFAVKELNVVDRRWAYRFEDVFRFERAAFAAGIPMPEPIAASADMLVHRWVEGERLPEAPVPASFAFEIGETLARIHALDVEWTDVSVEEPTPRDWPELAARASATGQPWAEELASHVGTFLAIADLIDTCERPGPVVLTHKDIQPWNLLVRDGRPIILDWELSGTLDLAGELGSTALSIAKGPGFDDIEPAVFRSVLDGYVAGGGVLPPPGPSWFVFLISGWLGFTRWNIVRCVAGVEPGSGPDLAMSHDEVRNGVRGLPEMFDLLPELVDLLVRRALPGGPEPARPHAVDRIEIEMKLNRSRTDCIEKLSKLSETELHAPRTQSQHDPSLWWSQADHFIHTTAIEKTFNAMIRRHIAGERGMEGSPVQLDDEGKPAVPWEDIMKAVNARTEEWAIQHRGKPLDELVRIGAEVRGETLQLLSTLTDEQLADRIPGAPWAKGVVGGIIAINADHAYVHHSYGEDGSGPEHP